MVWLRYLLLVLLPVIIVCRSSESTKNGANPQRIISLAPSITETLFALGLGDRIVGVTRFCTYPPEASHKEIVGGYSDANLEKIISLRPDLVICSPEHEKQQRYLNQFSIPVLSVRNGTCAEICSTFAAIGRRCDANRLADSLIQLFHTALHSVTNTTDGHRPTILFCVGRDNPGTGVITTAFVAGMATFYNDLIDAAGGRNAFSGNGQMFPRISLEGVLAADPDIIIDMAPAMDNLPCSRMVDDWKSLERISAVRNGHVYCIADSYGTLPGPRLLLLLGDLKKFVAAALKDTAS